MRATAVAHPNIALVKYWGKRNIDSNLPATGSVSMTLAGLRTETTVEFTEAAKHDSLQLDGEPVESGRALGRVEEFLDLIRERAQLAAGARVESRNNFPTAGGLASSASGFAALARAASEAAGLELSERELSALARRGSGSAARSIFGGFVEMLPGDDDRGAEAYARPIADESHWDLRCIAAETAAGPKRVGSTEGMLHTERTSPYYDDWLEVASADVESAVEAIEERDFECLARIAETSCLRMHATALAADPPLLYWNGTTVELIRRVRAERERGLAAFFTVDAGPHLKVFCTPESEAQVIELLDSHEGVFAIHETRPGPGAHLVDPVGSSS